MIHQSLANELLPCISDPTRVERLNADGAPGFPGDGRRISTGPICGWAEYRDLETGGLSENIRVDEKDLNDIRVASSSCLSLRLNLGGCLQRQASISCRGHQDQTWDSTVMLDWHFNAWCWPTNPNRLSDRLKEMAPAHGLDFVPLEWGAGFGISRWDEWNGHQAWPLIVDWVRQGLKAITTVGAGAMAETLLDKDLVVVIRKGAAEELERAIIETVSNRRFSGSRAIDITFTGDSTVVRCQGTSDEDGGRILVDLVVRLREMGQTEAARRGIASIAVRTVGRYVALKPIELFGVSFDAHRLLADVAMRCSQLVGLGLARELDEQETVESPPT